MSAVAIREVAEKTGLKAEVTDLIGVYTSPSGRIVTYPDNGDMVQLTDVIVHARVLAGRLICSDDSARLDYFGQGQLPVEIVPPARQPIVDAFECLRGVLS